MRALVATALATTPLAELFTNDRWFLDVAVAAAVVALPAAVIRRWHPPRVWHAWLGLALLVPWLTLRFLSDSAIGSVLPGPATVRAANALLSTVRETSAKGIAPVLPTPGITFVLAAIAGLLMAFVDLVAVVGRRPAVAGLPFLVIFAACGAVRRHPVSWLLFLGPAVAFLLLLSIEARSIVRQWGRVIPRAGETRPSTALGVSVFRIGIIALVVAASGAAGGRSRTAATSSPTPCTIPVQGRGGSHLGAGSGTSLDPFAALAGDLQRAKPVKLFTVHVDPVAARPVLPARERAQRVHAGRMAGGHSRDLGRHGRPLCRHRPRGRHLGRGAIHRDACPSPACGTTRRSSRRPSRWATSPRRTRWSASDELLTGSTVSSGQVITEVVSQPSPTVSDLNEASADYPPVVRPDLLDAGAARARHQPGGHDDQIGDDALPEGPRHQRLLHHPDQRVQLQPADQGGRLRRRAQRLPDQPYAGSASSTRRPWRSCCGWPAFRPGWCSGTPIRHRTVRATSR